MEQQYKSLSPSPIDRDKEMRLIKVALQDDTFKKIYSKGYKTITSPEYDPFEAEK